MHEAAKARARAAFGGNLSSYVRHLIEQDLRAQAGETPCPAPCGSLNHVLEEFCGRIDPPTVESLSVVMAGHNQILVSVDLLRGLVGFVKANPDFNDRCRLRIVLDEART
jgi:hypothetical protein